MIREICTDEAFLAQKAEEADAGDGYLARDLRDTLAAHAEGCVGMAANMIGVNKRVIVFEEEGRYTVLFNPRVIRAQGAYTAREGCLSLKGERSAKRFHTVKVFYQDEAMKPHYKTYTGFTAQIVQHEIDHCDGILI